MYKIYLLLLIIVPFLFSCSGDDSDSNAQFAEDILGGWQLERIKVEGADCNAVFGSDIPEMYLADEEGCARPTEIQGNAKRCINLEFRENGEGTFFWSEISGSLDAPITYNIVDNGIEYCFVGSACSGFYKFVGSRLESSVELRLEEECRAVYVLKRK